MAIQQFDYTGISNTAIGLIKKFGKRIPLAVLRQVEGAPLSPSTPWRVGPGSTLTFPFLGIALTIGYAKHSDPTADREQTIYVPGDIVDTPANEDATMLCGFLSLSDRIQFIDTPTGRNVYQITGLQDITPNDKPACFILKAKAWPLLNRQPASAF